MPVEHLLRVSITTSDICQMYTVSHAPTSANDWLPPSTLINRSPLFSRGWVCQERILSPRLLTFSSSYLYWHCGLWSGPEWQRPTDKPQNAHERRNLTIGLDFDWRVVVRVCSESHLTYPKDRLVAISGIAKRIHRIYPDKYLAGMWRKDLERSLCWSVTQPQRASAMEYQAPSWSWASLLPGTRAYPPYDAQGTEKLLITLADIDMTLAGTDPMGAVSRGCLKVLCEAMARLAPNGEQQYLLVTPGFVLSSVCFKFDSEASMASATSSYLLPVVQDRVKAERVYFQGLIIKPTNKRQGEYNRVGHFSNNC